MGAGAAHAGLCAGTQGGGCRLTLCVLQESSPIPAAGTAVYMKTKHTPPRGRAVLITQVVLLYVRLGRERSRTRVLSLPRLGTVNWLHLL